MDGTPKHSSGQPQFSGASGAATLERALTPEHFERVYHDAAGDPGRIPWADQRANTSLVNWLNAEAPAIVRCGGRAAVVGCGLGDDVAEISARGYDACGFDCSATAIDWARSRFPTLAPSFFQADLLNLPSRLLHRFDLVVEVYTLQSMEPEMREKAAKAVAALANRNAVVLTIARGRDESEPLSAVQGPPYPFTARELDSLMRSCGLRPTRGIDDFFDDEKPAKRRLRASWVHG